MLDVAGRDAEPMEATMRSSGTPPALRPVAVSPFSLSVSFSFSSLFALPAALPAASLRRVGDRRRPRLRWWLGLMGLASLVAPAAPASAAPPPPTWAGEVRVDGGAVFVETFGAGYPLVLLHDGMAHAEVWDAQVEAFAPHYRVVRYDRRGYGRSAMPESAYSNVDDLARVFAALSIERAVVIGSSAGGGLAIDFALEHPAKVEALILSGPVVNGLGYTWHFLRRAIGNFGAEEGATIENWIADRYAVSPGNDGARERFAALLRAYPKNLAQRQHQLAVNPRTGALQRLGEIHVPVLLLTGENDIPDVHAHMGAIEAGIAGARRVVLEDAGHLGYLEQPEAFNAEVRDFLSLLALAPGSPRLLSPPPPPWDSFTHGFMPVAGTRLYYQAMGSGEAVVLLHGGAIDHRMWDLQFEELARDHRVIRYDARGFGLSNSPFGEYRHFEDLRQLLHGLALQRPHLVGLSMGCRSAVDFAIAHPAELGALVLCSPGLSGMRFESEEFARHLEAIRDAYGRSDFAQAAEEFVRGWCDGPRRSPEETPPEVRGPIKAMALQIIRPGRDLGRGGELEPPAISRLAEIQAPVLVLEGGIDMPDIHAAVARIEREVPGARVVRLPGAAHMVNMEEPAAVNGEIRGFLATHHAR